MREHKAAGCRDRKGGGGEPLAGSRKWPGRGRADHRLMGKVIQIAGNWIWHMYNSVCWLKVDTLELFPTQLFPAQNSSEITDLHVNADAWPPLQTHSRSWLPVSGWPGQGDLRLALWGTWGPPSCAAGGAESHGRPLRPCSLLAMAGAGDGQLAVSRSLSAGGQGVLQFYSSPAFVGCYFPLSPIFQESRTGKTHNGLIAAAQNATGIDPWAGPVLWKCICGERYVLA